MELQERIKKIRLILMDVDGVLTDEGIAYGPFPEELKVFNVKDGLGIKLAQTAGLAVGIISSRSSEALKIRSNELGIELLYQGQENKFKTYQKIKKDLYLSDEQVAYIGDDLTDLSILKAVGFSVAVKNACEEVIKSADFITNKSGGKGAVRDVIEIILREQGKWEQLLAAY